jgi:choline-phosphate cytidylyltransferase
MAKNGTCTRKIRIYTDGVFDLFHQGHSRLMMQVKNMFPKSEIYVIAGISDDALTFPLKGPTVMVDEERYEAIRHCRYVDEIFCGVPWVTTLDFIQKHKIDFLARDAEPYPMGDCPDIYQEIKEKGYFIATERTNG